MDYDDLRGPLTGIIVDDVSRCKNQLVYSFIDVFT
jgi:hypothetical protein